MENPEPGFLLDDPADRALLQTALLSGRNQSGSGATVGAAVRSIQMQTLQEWELIVIDNGSSDNTGSIVNGFGDSRIRLIREAPGAGLATRLNQAAALSRGEFIARMDADDVCFPERLARQIERLQQDPELDVLSCGAVVFTDHAELVGELLVGLTHCEIAARPFVGFPFPHPTWCGRAAWCRPRRLRPRGGKPRTAGSDTHSIRRRGPFLPLAA